MGSAALYSTMKKQKPRQNNKSKRQLIHRQVYLGHFLTYLHKIGNTRVIGGLNQHFWKFKVVAAAILDWYVGLCLGHQ